MEVVSLRPMLVMLAHNFALASERAQDPTSRWLFYYVGVQDCARAFRCALEAPELPYPTCFITASDSCHPKPTLEWLEAAHGTLPEIRVPKLYQDNPRASAFSGSRARDMLGFSPTTEWHTLEASHSQREEQ